MANAKRGKWSENHDLVVILVFASGYYGLLREFTWVPKLGVDYMSRAGPARRAGSVYRDDCSARYYMRRASPPAAKFRSCRVKRWLHQRA